MKLIRKHHKAFGEHLKDNNYAFLDFNTMKIIDENIDSENFFSWIENNGNPNEQINSIGVLDIDSFYKIGALEIVSIIKESLKDMGNCILTTPFDSHAKLYKTENEECKYILFHICDNGVVRFKFNNEKVIPAFYFTYISCFQYDCIKDTDYFKTPKCRLLPIIEYIQELSDDWNAEQYKDKYCFDYILSLFLILHQFEGFVENRNFIHDSLKESAMLAHGFKRYYKLFVKQNFRIEIKSIFKKILSLLNEDKETIKEELYNLLSDTYSIITMFKEIDIVNDFNETQCELVSAENIDSLFASIKPREVSNYSFRANGLNLNNFNFLLQTVKPDVIKDFNGSTMYNVENVKGFNLEKVSVQEEHFDYEMKDAISDKLFHYFETSKYRTLPFDSNNIDRKIYKKKPEIIHWSKFTPQYFVNNGVFYYSEDKAYFSHIFSNMIVTLSCDLTDEYDEYELLMRYFSFYLIQVVDYIAKNGLNLYYPSCQFAYATRLVNMEDYLNDTDKLIKTYTHYDTHVAKIKTLAGIMEYWFGIITILEETSLTLPDDELKTIDNLINRIFDFMIDNKYSLSDVKEFMDNLGYNIPKTSLYRILGVEEEKAMYDHIFDYCDEFFPDYRKDWNKNKRKVLINSELFDAVVLKKVEKLFENIDNL